MTAMNSHAGRSPTSQVPVGVLAAGVPTSVLSCEYPKRYRLIADEFG
jgi:hypothetical protein